MTITSPVGKGMPPSSELGASKRWRVAAGQPPVPNEGRAARALATVRRQGRQAEGRGQWARSPGAGLGGCWQLAPAGAPPGRFRAPAASGTPAPARRAATSRAPCRAATSRSPSAPTSCPCRAASPGPGPPPPGRAASPASRRSGRPLPAPAPAPAPPRPRGPRLARQPGPRPGPSPAGAQRGSSWSRGRQSAWSSAPTPACAGQWRTWPHPGAVARAGAVCSAQGS
mmetsp:Transcript_98891/g.280104  ORF Transcript_98891/g.280104 Transcript_98891/m.280104 type:complete len:227 (-) Transcript_98891:1427-2107(-)